MKRTTVKKKPVIDTHGHDLSKKVMKRLIGIEKNPKKVISLDLPRKESLEDAEKAM